MAGETNAIKTAVKAKLAATAGILYAYDRLQDTLAGSPAAIMGDHSHSLEPGSWERRVWTFGITIAVSSQDRDFADVDTAMNDVLDALIAEFRSGVQLGNTVMASLLDGWDLGRFETIGGEEWWLRPVSLRVFTAAGATYTS